MKINLGDLQFESYMESVEETVDKHLARLRADEDQLIDLYDLSPILLSLQNLVYDVYRIYFARKLVIGVRSKSKVFVDEFQLFTIDSIPELLAVITLLNAGKQSAELALNGAKFPVVYQYDDLAMLIDILDFLHNKSVEADFIIISMYEKCRKLDGKHNGRGITQKEFKNIVMECAAQAESSVEQCGNAKNVIADAIECKNKLSFDNNSNTPIMNINNGGYLN